MNDYNWEERNIITFDRPEDVALYTNDLHVWYGTNEAIKGIDLQFEKTKLPH
ncbi:Phosphate transport ATP-binding protein PstB [Enterococcus sp. HSIEG1]|nr:Phosphate transport ATP-binding protein PstB [Enterococcus sp. HSIEG1]